MFKKSISMLLLASVVLSIFACNGGTSTTGSSADGNSSKNNNGIKIVADYSPDTLVDEMETITFGSYPQSDKSGNEKEPIEWLVLENNKDDMLLLSKYILDCKCYNDERTDITWETSTLRNWLNDTFYNTAFNDDEKKRIIQSTIINADNSDYGVSGGNDTSDYTYLLSIDECRKYFGSEDEKGFNKRLITKGTDYAKNVNNKDNTLDIYEGTEWYAGNSNFWLRSPGATTSDATFVNYGGYLYTGGDRVDYSAEGIRPLLRIKAK